MKTNQISFDELISIVKKLNTLSVHVLGDSIVDTYTRTNFIGGQTKTPTFSVLYDKEENYVGGAAIVALHLKAAGAKVSFTSLVSNDKKGKFVKDQLRKNKITSTFLRKKTDPQQTKILLFRQITDF